MNIFTRLFRFFHRPKRTWIPVGDRPESEKTNWFGVHRNVQEQDKRKLRGHLTRP